MQEAEMVNALGAAIAIDRRELDSIDPLRRCDSCRRDPLSEHAPSPFHRDENLLGDVAGYAMMLTPIAAGARMRSLRAAEFTLARSAAGLKGGKLGPRAGSTNLFAPTPQMTHGR